MRFAAPTAAVLAGLWMPLSLLAQTSRIAVIDFERAVVESVEGKKAANDFNARLAEKQKELEKMQQELAELENTLQTQERSLSAERRLELTRSIDRKRTDLTRATEDAEKEFAGLREQLLQPIAESASTLLKTYFDELGFAVLIDVSAPQHNVLYVDEEVNITEAFVRRLDEEAARKAAAQPK
jgi:Skp family chaperone for outer membrane proteins